MASELERELTQLLNKHSIENHSNTPDFILAKYLLGVLGVWNACTQHREQWYGRGAQFLSGVPDTEPSKARIQLAKRVPNDAALNIRRWARWGSWW